MDSPATTAPADTSSSAGAARAYAGPVRYRHDVGWELRCERCAKKGVACFWPLTDEFWNHKLGMTKCLGCRRTARRIAEAARLRRENADARARRLERTRAYRVDAADAIRISREALLTPERIAAHRASDRARRLNETPEQRANRLTKLREWKRRNPERMQACRDRYLSSEKGKAARRGQYLRRMARAA